MDGKSNSMPSFAAHFTHHEPSNTAGLLGATFSFAFFTIIISLFLPLAPSYLPVPIKAKHHPVADKRYLRYNQYLVRDCSCGYT